MLARFTTTDDTDILVNPLKVRQCVGVKLDNGADGTHIYLDDGLRYEVKEDIVEAENIFHAIPADLIHHTLHFMIGNRHRLNASSVMLFLGDQIVEAIEREKRKR